MSAMIRNTYSSRCRLAVVSFSARISPVLRLRLCNCL